MMHVGMHEAKTTLSKLVARAQAGEEIVITRHGKPVVRLAPVVEPSRFAASYGFMAGRIRLADDFDDPLPDEIADSFGLR